MSEVSPDLEKFADSTQAVRLTIKRPPDGQSLQMTIKSEVLADIVEKMTIGNAPKEHYDKIYASIFMTHPDPEAVKNGRIATRPAIVKITKNFIGDPGFAWDTPRSILIANPVKLREGFTLNFKVEQPVPPDTIRKWGKQFMDGCNDIISNARAFTMNWVMSETPEVAR
jgi:hypothetical protein